MIGFFSFEDFFIYLTLGWETTQETTALHV